MTSVKAISAVVFDMGGVLTVDPYEACRDYARELGIPPDTFVDQLRSPQFVQVETGALSMRDFLKHACSEAEAQHGVRVDIRRLAAALAAGQQVRPEMVTLLADLVARDVRIGLLTNNVKEARAWWSSGVIPLESFTAVVDSSEVGVRKPDPAIFRITAERIGCPSDELLFFDDSAENVAGANVAGLDGQLFTGPQECRRTCQEYGLL